MFYLSPFFSKFTAMVSIQKGTSNTVILQLTENSTLVNPYYLFVFSKGGLDYPVISADLATTEEKVRFNEFSITEGSSDPTNGSLILGTVGVYELTVYEQSSSTNLIPANATGIVRNTLARIIDTESSSWVENEIDEKYYEHSISI